MSNLSEALHDATKLGAFLENFNRAKIVLETAAQIEGQQVDAVALRDRAQKEAKDAVEKAAVANAVLKEVTDGLAAKRLEAEQITKDARSEADEIKLAARTEARRIEGAAKLTEENAEASARILRAEASTLRISIDHLKTEEQAIRERIDTAMADARAKLGG
jgi:response regulator of citrate/malate metabolism